MLCDYIKSSYKYLVRLLGATEETTQSESSIIASMINQWCNLIEKLNNLRVLTQTLFS